MSLVIFFFFNDTATTEIYTLSLHDALPISTANSDPSPSPAMASSRPNFALLLADGAEAHEREVDQRRLVAHGGRSEEHTSELQSRQYLVCRLLLEKKNPT